jgi:hypothetical protein
MIKTEGVQMYLLVLFVKFLYICWQMLTNVIWKSLFCNKKKLNEGTLNLILHDALENLQ